MQSDSMTDSRPHDPPSAFIERQLRERRGEIPAPRRALDMAAGRGRHAVVLAQAGLRVYAVDNNVDALRTAAARVRDAGGQLSAWCADLTISRLPRARFDVIVVTRYLQRDLFPDLMAALTPGGILLYETFTEQQRSRGRGPTSPHHLLQLDELPALAQGLSVISYAEVDDGIDAVAQLVAQRRVE
jgi:tellurite methyltransferase